MKKKLHGNPGKIVVLGTLGDVNPIDHGGGVVYKRHGKGVSSQPMIAYFEPDDEDDDTMVNVYRVDVPDDVMEHVDNMTSHDLAKWKDIAKSNDLNFGDLDVWSDSRDPVLRAEVVRMLADHVGWHELDTDPLRMTHEQAESWYDERFGNARHANPTPKSKASARAKARRKLHLFRVGTTLAKHPRPPWKKHKNPLPDWILEFSVDKHGVIRSPGKFQGEPLWVPYFWDIYLDGGQDDENAKGELIFNVQDADVAEFPELKGKQRVYIYERDDGFVYGRAV